MCRIRTHIHHPCGCKTHHIRLCSTFNPPPCPSAPCDASGFITAINESFSIEMLSGYPKLYAFPDEIDAFPCKNHMGMIKDDPSLLLGPPRAKEDSSDVSPKSVSDAGKESPASQGVQEGPAGFRRSSRIVKGLGILLGHRE